MKTKKPARARGTINRNRDLPATMGMLYEVRDELKSDILSLKYGEKEWRSGFQELKSGQGTLEARMDRLEAKMDSGFANLRVDLHKMLLLMEEQNARNKFVLDKLTFVSDKQDNHEFRITRLEKSK